MFFFDKKKNSITHFILKENYDCNLTNVKQVFKTFFIIMLQF